MIPFEEFRDRLKEKHRLAHVLTCAILDECWNLDRIKIELLPVLPAVYEAVLRAVERYLSEGDEKACQK
jgi:hypothetical protein